MEDSKNVGLHSFAIIDDLIYQVTFFMNIHQFFPKISLIKREKKMLSAVSETLLVFCLWLLKNQNVFKDSSLLYYKI